MKFEVNRKTILAVAAHPDDLDFGCSGSIAKWINDGALAYYLILTDGSKGSKDLTITKEVLIETRKKEQKKAAGLLGVKKVMFAGFVDGELVNSYELRREIVKIIRSVKPDIVITTDPTLIYSAEYGFINHPDHRACGQATLDSIHPFSKNFRSFPDLLEQNLKPHSVSEVLLINFSNGNYTVDITKTFDKKVQSLRVHQSQIGHIDLKTFRQRLEKRAINLGKKIKAKYAESFIRIKLR